MSMTEAQQFFVDAMAPASRDDPYPLYASFRERQPMALVDDATWLVLGHAEVTACLRHPLLSSNEQRSINFAREVAADPGRALPVSAPSLLFMDPPDHTRLRGLVARAFTPRRVEGLRARAEAVVADLLDGMAAGPGEVDLIASLAYPLPVKVICTLLGIPDEDEVRFAAWSKVLVRSIDPTILRSPEIEAQIVVAAGELTHYMEDLVERRASAPGDDLLSALLAVEAEGDRITHAELIELAMLLLVAGHETTVNLIGNGMLALLDHPDQRALAQRRPELLASAVDELLRFDSPVQMNMRVATEDVEVGGHQLEVGVELVLVLGAANRDPGAFARPDDLDLTRDARRHVAFGGGIHHCLGAALARMEGQVAIAGLLARFPDVAQAGDIVRRPTFTLRGLEHLPVRLG
ncbi:MAG: Unspecific monooxygenase [Actinomycetia bacterium]|nr:Unspecific monooxygenase [Actinomycetes bacterium]